MERLWAPWRMEYLLSDEAAGNGCIFCDKAASQDDRKNYVILRSEHTYVMLNIYPYSNGHLMVSPYEHVATPEDLGQDTLTELMDMITRSISLLRRAMNPDGVNIGANIGKAAGAGFADHLHVHVVPRWEGDTNFMPVVGETRVVPESLDDTYVRLSSALRELGWDQPPLE